MNRTKIIYGSAFLIILVIIIYTITDEESPEAYSKAIQQERQEKEGFMSNDEESPFVEQGVAFKGLKYFKPDLKYKIKARFEPIDDKEVVTLPTSDNIEKQYLEYGYAIFELDGQKHKLLILQNAEDNVLFLAFGDQTSAAETYGGGRYLEVTHSSGNSIMLDFNKAYNPYCAYTDGYSCPLPPRENLLDVAIRAGEKTYE